MTCGHFLDDRPEIPILPLEPSLILRQKPLEMMEQQTIEDGSLRMTRTVYSRHSGITTSGITPRAGQTESAKDPSD
jgi:hypothetical protein